jgi:hypothetical protein
MSGRFIPTEINRCRPYLYIFEFHYPPSDLASLTTSVKRLAVKKDSLLFVKVASCHITINVLVQRELVIKLYVFYKPSSCFVA